MRSLATPCLAQSVLCRGSANTSQRCDLIQAKIARALPHYLAHNNGQHRLLSLGVVFANALGKFARPADGTATATRRFAVW
jgi:hypothetical protein